MARILVTGAAGYLGSELMHRLHGLGVDVVGLSRRESPGLLTCDLLDADNLRRVIAETAPDRIIHAAAHVPQTLSEYNDPHCAQQSLRMIENVLAVTSASGTPLVYVSSMTVYGPNGNVVRREDDAGHPESSYGAGKWEGEQSIRASGRDAIAVRIPGLFGGRRIGGLVGNTIRALSSGEEPVLPTQPILWAAMHVRDAAQGIAGLTGASFSGFLPVNFGYSETYSISRFAELACSLFQRPCSYKQTQPDFEFELSRARGFGVATHTTLKDALLSLRKELV